jgi:hypothetical protein
MIIIQILADKCGQWVIRHLQTQSIFRRFQLVSLAKNPSHILLAIRKLHYVIHGVIIFSDMFRSFEGTP